MLTKQETSIQLEKKKVVIALYHCVTTRIRQLYERPGGTKTVTLC